MRCLLAALAITCAAGRPARAGVEDWQVNEVLARGGGDTEIRYVELYSEPGGCLFPSSRIEVYAADGTFVDAVAPVAATTCFGPDTYFLFATGPAQLYFLVDDDHGLVPPIPEAAGQLCFTSSATRYDCVRWGAVTAPVADFFAPDDDTAAPPPADLAPLTRVSTVHVVEVDWTIGAPTPRGPNDGTPWSPPDAGPTPDAMPGAPDAAITDAAPRADGRPDATPRPDAGDDRFLDLEATGGACSAGGEGGAGVAAVVLVAIGAARRRRWRR